MLRTYITTEHQQYLFSSLWQLRRYSLAMNPPLPSLCLQNLPSSSSIKRSHYHLGDLHKFHQTRLLLQLLYERAAPKGSHTSKAFVERSPGPRCPSASLHASPSEKNAVACEMPHIKRCCARVSGRWCEIAAHRRETPKKPPKNAKWLNQMGIKISLCLFHTPAVGPCWGGKAN